ncbi:hypothetical protein TNCT_209361, partial [Trichonephila clavata]
MKTLKAKKLWSSRKPMYGIDLGQMKVTREEKEDIARKLENKIPVEAILDDIRNSVNEKLERIHLNINSDVILDANDE